MNKSLLSIILIGLLLVLALYLYIASDGSVQKINNQPEDPNAQISQEEKIDTKAYDKLSVIKPSTDIEEFNQYLFEHISIGGYSRKETISSKIIGTVNAENIDFVAEQYMQIRQDPKTHQLAMRELFGSCLALKKRETDTLESSTTSNKLNFEYQLLALQKSGYCDHIGTKSDPFYVILDLARKGDKVAQLYLIDDLNYAIQRGLINPKIYPIEYNDLRNEIIGYLKSLSARGVIQATMNLQRVYGTRNFLLPKDEVMRYYYAVLVEKQSNNQVIYDYPSNQLYDWLTETEKVKADKMTENLK
jgi:hypothetical protein